MSETPRTDTLVRKMQSEEDSFIDAYHQMRELAGDLERALNKTRSVTTRKKPGPRPAASTSAKKDSGKAQLSLP